MPIAKITKEFVENVPLPPPGTREVHYWDTVFIGFGLRVTCGEKKAYVLRLWFPNREVKQSQQTIGRTYLMDPQQARAKAKDIMLREMATETEKEALRKADELLLREQARKITFADFAAIYMDQYAKPHKKTWKLDNQRLQNHLLPELGDRLLTEIKRIDIVTLHNRIGETKPVAANRVREQVARMYELAKQWEYIPASYPNPAQNIMDFKETPRDRWCNADEIARINESLNEEGPVVAAFIRLAILTGRRKSELLKLRWEHVDLEHGRMKIEMTKNGKRLNAPISPQVVEVFKSLPIDGAFCFAGKIKGQPRNTIDKAWQRVRKRAGIPDVRVHDLRHTFGSWMAQQGHNAQTIGRSMGHASLRSTEVYMHFGEENIRDAVTGYNETIAGLLGVQSASEDQVNASCTT